MTAEELKRNLRRGFEEGMNGRNFAVFDEFLAPNYVNHTLPAPMPGPEGMKAVVGMFLAAFPDFHVVVEDVLCDGNLLCTRGYFTGTHNGDFQGIPPPGKSFKAGYIDVWRAENGKFAENWVQLDMLSLMQQLGVIPAPQAA